MKNRTRALLSKWGRGNVEASGARVKYWANCLSSSEGVSCSCEPEPLHGGVNESTIVTQAVDCRENEGIKKTWTQRVFKCWLQGERVA